MKLVSIQVGKVKTHLLADGSEWTTAYFKDTVNGRVFVNQLHVEGDEQKHKRVHGGVHRPVLMYSADHYARWKAELNVDFPYGAFSENFTVSDINEDSACIGDIYRVGDTLTIQISQPRVPCNQIDRCWNMPRFHHLVSQRYRTGWYLRVLTEGYAEAEMPITLVERPYPRWTIRQAHDLYDDPTSNPEQALALSQCDALEIGWRERLAKVKQ